MGNYLPQVQTEYDKYEARLGKALDHFKSEMISVISASTLRTTARSSVSCSRS